VPNPKNPGKTRVCVDKLQANQSIERECYITPSINELVSDLNGAAVFSKLDLITDVAATESSVNRNQRRFHSYRWENIC